MLTKLMIEGTPIERSHNLPSTTLIYRQVLTHAVGTLVVCVTALSILGVTGHSSGADSLASASAAESLSG